MSTSLNEYAFIYYGYDTTKRQSADRLLEGCPIVESYRVHETRAV